jgi:hypothetical protein
MFGNMIGTVLGRKRQKEREEFIRGALTKLGEAIDKLTEDGNKPDDTGGPNPLIDLVRKTLTIDELNEVIVKYQHVDSMSFNFAVILQMQNIMFEGMEKQIGILQKQIDSLRETKVEILAAGPGRKVTWTVKQKQVRDMIEKGATTEEILGAGHSKATLSRVRTALEEEKVSKA